MQNLIDQIEAEIASRKRNLDVARQAAQSIAELEVDVQRLEAAAKALGAPQTPAGRKRIGDGERRRRHDKQTAVQDGSVAASAPVIVVDMGCGHCGAPALKCIDSDCDWRVCPPCATAHNQRFHAE